jgi:hypothetical protein
MVESNTLLILTHCCDRPLTSTLGDLFLNVFALTDNLQERVQGISAEPANDSVQRRPTTLNVRGEDSVRPCNRIVSDYGDSGKCGISWLRHTHGCAREVQISSMGLNQDWLSKVGKRMDIRSGTASPHVKSGVPQSAQKLRVVTPPVLP